MRGIDIENVVEDMGRWVSGVDVRNKRFVRHYGVLENPESSNDLSIIPGRRIVGKLDSRSKFQVWAKRGNFGSKGMAWIGSDDRADMLRIT